ncbi:YfhO family protein [Portibacter marinus]|uniref:YfhO family protein n=1 Tax=Portibacter marinus TaxID=2898660 RepID=UPI001F3E2EAB|nr:YfhO family protein [Portibacter marinus]
MNFSKFKHTQYLAFALIVLGLIIIFFKYLSLSHLFIFEDIGTDTLTLFYPSLMDYVRLIREEGIPFFSFAKGAGQSSFSESLLSPFTWVYVILGNQYLAYGIGFVQFLKVAVIMIASYHIFKLQGLSSKAASFGASLTSFMGYVVVGSSWYGHSTNIMYMLLFLWGLELWIVRRRWWLLPIAALFLIGPPLFFVIEFTIIYLVIRMAMSKNLNLNSFQTGLTNVWKPLLTGVLLGAPFLAAVVYKFIYSPRVGGTESYVEDLSATPIFETNIAEHYATTIYRFFSNDLLGTGDGFRGFNNYLEAPLFYCGLITLLLVPQIFRFIDRKQKIVVGSVLLFWTLILVFPYFRYAFYLFMGNYYKGALSFFIPFTLLWLSVMVIDRMIKGYRLNLYLLYASAALLIGILFSHQLISANIVPVNSIRNTVLVFLILETVLLTIHQFSSRKKILQYTLLLVVITEGVILSFPALNNRSSIASDRWNNRELYQDYALESIKYIHSIEDGFYRIEKNFGSYKTGLNDSQAQGFFDTKSYRSHNNENYVNFFIALDMIQPGNEHVSRWLEGVYRVPELHPYFQIKYMIAQPGRNVDMLSQYYDNVGQLKGLNVHKNRHFVPLGFPVSDYITESEFAGLGAYFKKLNALYNYAVIPDEDVNRYPDLIRKDPSRISNSISFSSISNKYQSTALNITSFKQSRIKGNIALSQPSMLTFSIPFDTGWKAYVDGKRQETSLIDNGMTGLYVTSGNHVITLKYRPPFFMASMILFTFGLGFLIYFGVMTRPVHKDPLLEPLTFSHCSQNLLQKSTGKSSKVVKSAGNNSKVKKKRKKK